MESGLKVSRGTCLGLSDQEELAGNVYFVNRTSSAWEGVERPFHPRRQNRGGGVQAHCKLLAS